MKQICIALLLVGAIASHLFSQKIRIGLHAGFGKAQLSNFHETKDDYFGADWVSSPLFGGTVDYYVGERFSLGLGVDYARKGNNRYGFENKYHYVEIPVSARLDFFRTSSRNLLFFARLGFYTGFLQNQTNNGYSALLSLYLLEYSSVRDIDFGLTGSLGVQIRLLKNVSLTAEFRAERGLFDVFGLPDCPGCDRSRISNIAGWGMLGMAYTIPSPYDGGK